jgi:hypothetical protein
MLVYDDKPRISRKLLNELYAIEPTNEEILHPKCYLFQEITMKAVESSFKTALEQAI